MKYDLTKVPTRGAQRTLDAFSCTLFTLLSCKSFEEITVNMICDYCNYPRATFYNYFDDKYDLLDYFWYNIGKQIRIEEHPLLKAEESLYIFFDRIYELAKNNESQVKQVLRFNSGECYFLSHLKFYLKNQMRKIFDQCSGTIQYPIPYEIVSDHYSNTILLVLEWHFGNGNDCSKEQAHRYLKFLIGPF